MTEPAPPSTPDSEHITFPTLHDNANIIAAVSEQAPAVSEEHVAMVLKALYLVQNGDPVGTVLTNPETGEVALRISVNGVHQWRVTEATGGTRIETGTTLPGWTVLRSVTPEEPSA